MEGMTMPRKEAAAYIGISEDTLSRWCKLGLIAYTRKDPSKKKLSIPIYESCVYCGG